MQFLMILISTIKAKFTALWTKISRWTTKQFVTAKLLTAVRQFFSNTLSVKPRHSKDYYGFLAWLISRRLVYAIILVLGVLSLFYILVVNPVFQSTDDSDGLPVYSYDSLSLRFVSDKVKIKADSGYIAYVGDVEEGTCKGQGDLFDKDGDMVYTGAFVNNMYNGEGKQYFKNGQVHYDGSFRDNIYEGEGTLMRQSGSLEYVGGFSQGLKEGEGTLYDYSGKEIFKGLFSRDRLVYPEFLGRTTQEAKELYTGKSEIYRTKSDFAVTMPDINAMFTGRLDADSVEEAIVVDSVYVLDNRFYANGETIYDVRGLTAALGEPHYEGNSFATATEAVAINMLNKTGSAFTGRVEMSYLKPFDEVYDIESYDMDYPVYLYTYRYEGLMYTFFCSERYGGFEMYMITKE